MLARYCGPGFLGLGITALIAGFMSGMAGNVSAFTTVWTYDIYRALIKKDATDAHYVNMGRWSTMVGVLISIGTAYLVMHFTSIMDYVQALFSFFIAPLFGTVLLGMLWKRATPPAGSGDCWPARFLGWNVGVGEYGSDGAAVRGAFAVCERHGRKHVPRAVVLPDLRRGYGAGQPATKPKTEGELNGLVYGATDIPAETDVSTLHRPWFWAVVVGVIFVVLNIIFW